MSINFHSRIEAWITNYYLILFASKDIIILVKCAVSLVRGCVRLRGKNRNRDSLIRHGEVHVFHMNFRIYL